MIPHAAKFLDQHILIFVVLQQIIFSQMLMTTGLIVPQIDTTKNNLCIFETVNNQQSNDLKSLSINETIKEAYKHCNDKLENFNKILHFIEKQPTIDVKDLAYSVLYQEVLNHYMLEKSETIQMNLCLLEIILDKKEEAIMHFKDMKPSSLSQVLEYANNFQDDTYLTQFLKFIAKKSEISSIEHNIIVIALEMTNKTLGSGVFNFAGIKLLEIGAQLRTTKMESVYFNKLQAIWGEIILSYCNSVQYKPVIFTKLKNLPPHLHQMEGKFEKIENYFLDILIPSVRRVLNKEVVESKLDMILKCVPKSFPFIETGAILYSTVFDEVAMQNLSNTNNFITKFTYYIKNYMEAPNYSHIEEKYKEVFENLKRNIPDWARKLIWNGDSCMLKNRKWDQYLSACGEFGCNTASNTTSVDSYMIFAGQIDTTQGNAGVKSQWKFETNSQGNSFTVTNVGSGVGFLYNGSNVVDENEEMLRNPKVEPLWSITSSDSGSFITLQNTYNNEYLSVGDALKKDPLKRRVITQKLGSPLLELVQECEWKLICG